MVWNAKRQWKMSAVLLCLVLLVGAFPAGAQELGDWSGLFTNSSGTDYFDYAMDVPMDGTVVLTTTAASTLIGQFTAISVYDITDGRIKFTYVMESPATLSVPLAAGSFIVRISRSLNNFYGSFNIKADLTPASPGATEVENNDVIGAASTNPGNLFAGAIGYFRAKDTLDWYDYYRFTLTQDTNVHFDLTTADTLIDFDTVLSLMSASNVSMGFTYLSAASKTWDLHLAPGTYYLRLYIADWSRYGGYTIATTTTPAVENSSETENNDTLATANPIKSKTLHGSIGYYRDKAAGGAEDWDNLDNFSCQVAQGGTLRAEILCDDTLGLYPNTISIYNANNDRLTWDYLATSPRTVTVNHLAAGTYYIRVYRATGYGAYQINVSGNVFIPNPGSVGSTIFPLLLSN
jgi:hypothetical protein